jgi:hypothetical protein
VVVVVVVMVVVVIRWKGAEGRSCVPDPARCK